ncbi:hypothetical protein [Halobellus sp. GM3]|uniref:hypothetical protein n=1 Tax=Halobellus sp. GM3 TaxID=3458410 RepID=UPI00403D8C3E
MSGHHPDANRPTPPGEVRTAAAGGTDRPIVGRPAAGPPPRPDRRAESGSSGNVGGTLSEDHER